MTTEPYSTEAILRRNIAALEVALRTQTELKERAEGELAKLREQKPVMKYMGRRLTPKDTMESWGIDCDVNVRPEMGNPLYAAPVPAPHKGATHCDDCGLTWLDDGLNPLRCPYCKVPVPAPAVPAYLLERQENGLSWYIGATTRWGGSWHWTADVNSAIRFSREEDATACWVIISQYHVGIGGSGTTETTPKQHIFEDTRALLQSAEVRHDLYDYLHCGRCRSGADCACSAWCR